MKSFIFTLLLLTTSLHAHASSREEHIFVAFSERLQRKVSFRVPVDPVQPPALSISMLVDQSPWERTLFTPDVRDSVVILETRSSLQKHGNGFIADLGAHGQITLTFQGDGSCRVISTFSEFHLPDGELIPLCTYFYSKGPRPGFSGSN